MSRIFFHFCITFTIATPGNRIEIKRTRPRQGQGSDAHIPPPGPFCFTFFQLLFSSFFCPFCFILPFGCPFAFFFRLVPFSPFESSLVHPFHSRMHAFHYNRFHQFCSATRVFTSNSSSELCVSFSTSRLHADLPMTFSP